MLQITLTTQYYTKNPNTKTTYILDATETRVITKEQYRNIAESATFFRRLGGSVTQQRAYTCDGYNVVKDTAISPNRQTKTIRLIDFKWID